MPQDAEKLKFILGLKHLFRFSAAKFLYNEKIARIPVYSDEISKITCSIR